MRALYISTNEPVLVVVARDGRAVGLDVDAGAPERKTGSQRACCLAHLGRLIDRLSLQVPPPCTTTPPDNKFYIKGEDGTIRANPHILRDHFFHEGRVTETQAMFILEQATQMLSREPNLVSVQSPVTSASLVGQSTASNTLQYAAISTVNMYVHLGVPAGVLTDASPSTTL